MKAIILSAGQGSRFGHLASDQPKCLIDFNGRRLFDRRLDCARNRRPRICVTIDRKDSYDEDDMKVVEADGQLKAIGKRLPAAIVNAESIGLIAFRAGGATA